MDFTGIFNAIMSAFNADKLGEVSADAVPDKIIKKVRFDDQEKMTPQATQATQTPQQSKKVKDTAVFKTKTPTSSPQKLSPPTSSPPTLSPPTSSLKIKKVKEKRGQGTEVKKTKSIIRKKREKLESFFKKLKERDKNIIKEQIEEYDIVEKYAKKNNLDIRILLENLDSYKALLFLKKLSRQDTGSASITMGQYSADRKMLTHKSPEMEGWSHKFRKEHKQLFNSLANAGLDPLNQNNKQGGSSFKNLVPSNSPKPNKPAQTPTTPGSTRVRGG